MLTDKEYKIELVNKLRQLTGYGLMDCKKHLVEVDWDIKEAEKLIRSDNKSFAMRDGAIWL